MFTEAGAGDADAARLTVLEMVTRLDTTEDAAALTRRLLELGGVSATSRMPPCGSAAQAGHPFYQRLNRVLDEAGLDAFVEEQCAKFYADGVGRPSLAPGRYFRKKD